MNELHHWIGGKKVDGENGRFGDITNPATGEIEAKVPFAGSELIDRTVSVAREAFPSWAATPPLQRARVMFAFKTLIERNLDRLAGLVTAEHGKVLDDAKGSITRGLEVVEFACGIPQLLKGEFTENVGRNVDSYSVRQPLGVCAGITPFNFPAMVPMWMFPVALACGNSFILKPSEKDPSTALVLAELLSEAGLPDGVFNVVNGDREAVDAILDPPGIIQQASGIIVDARGHIVTAAHIARTSKNEARIIVRDGSEHTASILYIDPKQDLALLKIAPFAGMKPALFAAENTVRRRDFAIAIGSPSRGRGAVSLGFVRIPRLKERLAYNRWGITDAIEISMEVESGHSGGPVFNRRGELIGMVAGYELGDTTKRPYISPRITYAIPIAGIRDFLKRAVVR